MLPCMQGMLVDLIATEWWRWNLLRQLNLSQTFFRTSLSLISWKHEREEGLCFQNYSRGSCSLMLDFLSLSSAKRLPLLCSQKLIQREAFTPLWLFSIWSPDNMIDIQCAVYFIKWKSTHWGIVSFPRVTLWQRVAAMHIKMIKAWLKSLTA